MRWFDGGKGTGVRKALFAERVPSKKALPGWLAGARVQSAPLEKWLTSRPDASAPKDSSPAPSMDGVRSRSSSVPVPRLSVPAVVETRLPGDAPRSIRPAEARAAAADALRSLRPVEARVGTIEAPRSMHPADPRLATPDGLRGDLIESLRPAWGPNGVAGIDTPSLRPDPIAAGAVRLDVGLPVVRDSAQAEEYERRLRAAAEALEASVEEIATLRARIDPELERQMVALASLIARRVIGRELSVHPELVASLAIEGMRALGERDKVVVRIGPLPEGALDTTVDKLRQHAPHCEVIVDPMLAPGQCMVRSEFGQVDESVDSRLEAVLNGLGGPSDEGE